MRFSTHAAFAALHLSGAKIKNRSPLCNIARLATVELADSSTFLNAVPLVYRHCRQAFTPLRVVIHDDSDKQKNGVTTVLDFFVVQSGSTRPEQPAALVQMHVKRASD